jgi:hypothetical protein
MTWFMLRTFVPLGMKNPLKDVVIIFTEKDTSKIVIINAVLIFLLVILS